MRTSRGRAQDFFYDPRYDGYDGYNRDVRVQRKKKHSNVSLAFCWGFGLVVCLTFGLASFMMMSAGHFGFSPDTGVNVAWGENERDDNFVTMGLLKVEVTELEAPENFAYEELYAQANGDIMEEFGPVPKYLSDYESIQLTASETGKDLPLLEDDEEEDSDLILSEVSTLEMKPKPEQPVMLAENGTVWLEHVVKNGETLSDIALAHGNITANDIMRANGLKDANKLSENQLLLIPNDSGKIEDTLDEVHKRQMRVAAKNEKVEPIRIKKYTVAPGDSMWAIASSQGIDPDTLIGCNSSNATTASLRPGIVLRIPNQDGIFYTMKNDETIEKVAKRYGVIMSKIRQANVDVDVASLKTGSEIFLPGAKTEAVMERHEPVKVAEVKKPVSNPAPKNSKSKSKAEKVSKTEKHDRAEKAAKNSRPVKLEKGEVAVKSSGGFRWPIMGRINSPFGWRQHPVTRRRDFHTGIDIKANRNDPIKAAGAGRVIYSGWMGGYGKVLVIEHYNGQSTLYAHCSALLAGKGVSVSSGQLVAKIGTTGRSTGPHLHFEVRNGNSPVNPIKYLSR